MTTRKFTPIIKRGPRLTPGEINVTPPDDLGVDIPPSGMQKALPWVMGGGMLGMIAIMIFTGIRQLSPYMLMMPLMMVMGTVGFMAGGGAGRQEGARDQRRPQGVPALPGRSAHPGDVVGRRAGDVLQLPRAASRRSAVDHRHQPAVVAAGQRRLLRRHPDRARDRSPPSTGCSSPRSAANSPARRRRRSRTWSRSATCG